MTSSKYSEVWNHFGVIAKPVSIRHHSENSNLSLKDLSAVKDLLFVPTANRQDSLDNAKECVINAADEIVVVETSIPVDMFR